MKCPICDYEFGDEEYIHESWFQCPNCDWNYNNAKWAMKKSNEVEKCKKLLDAFISEATLLPPTAIESAEVREWLVEFIKAAEELYQEMRMAA